MKFWHLIALGVALLVLYFILNPVFYVVLLFVIIWVIYKLYLLIERWMTPHGKRIKHGLLRGHLEAQYGTKEGNKLYKQTVTTLRKKGYR